MKEAEQPILEVKNLSKIYKLQKNGSYVDFAALKDINFQLFKGESIGLIGKNGSGKSTLLKIISGLVKPSSGEITINGKINSLIEIGSNFIPDISGRENVLLFLRLQGIETSKHEELCWKILEFSELGDYFDQAVKYYSSGMFVRLALSAGFHIEADLFLIDEVLMTGDSAFRSKVAKRFKKLVNKGVSIILASHSANEIAENCETCFWLDQGKILDKKPSSEALHYYYLDQAKIYIEKREEAAHSLFEKQPKHVGMENLPKQDLKNDLVEILNFEILNEDELSYADPIVVRIEINKLNSEVSLHPAIKIYDLYENPIIAIIASNESEYFQKLNQNAKQTGKLSFECTIPGKLLGAGTFWLDFTIIKDPVIGVDHFVEGYQLPTKLLLKIQKDEKISFGNTFYEVPLKLAAKWKV